MSIPAGVARVGLAAAVLLVALPAQAQTDYPNKPIKVIVPFAAGGGNDIFTQIGRAHV